MNDGLVSEQYKSISNTKFHYRCGSEKDGKCSILVYYGIDILNIKHYGVEMESDLLHDSNLIRLSSNYNIDKFLEENNLKMGEVDNIDDLTNRKCVFFIKKVLSYQRQTDLFQKDVNNEIKSSSKQIRFTNENLSNSIDIEFMNCPKCKLNLSEINLEKNKHLYDCLIENGMFGNELNQETSINLGKKHNRRKSSKVNRIFNFDNLSEKSEDNKALKTENGKSEQCENYLELKENLMTKKITKITKYPIEKSHKKIIDPKKIKKPNTTQELKSCPYCYKVYYKNEKKYNVHIAMCYEKNNLKSVISEEFQKKKRITYKPYFYEPLDYEKVEKYL